MTTFKTAESPFKSDSTASGRCGFTLMNNQVGAVIALVMGTKPNVKVTHLPSMIRIDAVDQSEFEEDMSTHYGRMIHTDDRTIMFANPEEAADYLGFDLTPVAG